MNRRPLRIRAVLFDYGMVLSGPPDPAAWLEMKRILDVDGIPFDELYWKHRDDYDRGILTGVAYWEHVARDLGRELSAAQLDELLAADTRLWSQPNDPMIEWAASLQRAGIKTGILSNLGDAMEAGILARFPWLAEFTHRTFSHRLGMAKPDAAIYRRAADGLETPVAEILFVDDREENIAAAKAAGMQGIRYVSHEQFRRDLHEAKFEINAP
jgi:putative hydrolase of the HAD superfamily